MVLRRYRLLIIVEQSLLKRLVGRGYPVIGKAVSI
jgi:hypothetical protein